LENDDPSRWFECYQQGKLRAPLSKDNQETKKNLVPRSNDNAGNSPGDVVMDKRRLASLSGGLAAIWFQKVLASFAAKPRPHKRQKPP
jgi:hypothetical protein